MIDRAARTQLLELLTVSEPKRNEYAAALGKEEPLPIFEGATMLLRVKHGRDIQREPPFPSSIENMCSDFVSDEQLLAFLAEVWDHLLRLSKFGQPAILKIKPDVFEEGVNGILKKAGDPHRLSNGTIVTAVSTEAEALRRLLLQDTAEAASCQQGDVQVEMVVSTIQKELERADSTLVDYGAGFGRVLMGLSTAQLFKATRYIAVDDPIADETKELASKVGGSVAFIRREEFLNSSKETANVLMVVNTLHHIPFKDLARQFAALLKRLKPGGFLLVHEMAELRDPEQRNVPWRIEDIQRLFSSALFKLNVRTTVTKGKKVPLSNVLLQLAGDGDVLEALTEASSAVWHQMKQRTLEEIAQLYASKDEENEVELQHLLIVNANLDLNSPT